MVSTNDFLARVVNNAKRTICVYNTAVQVHNNSQLTREEPSTRNLTEMGSKYKLMYLPLRIIGEPIRYIFAYAGVDYEDIRIEKSDWTRHKKDMAFGTMPVLEVDGKRGSQSIPICRYLAKQYGLMADNDWDNFQIDAAADAISDLRLVIKEYYYEDNESRKKDMKEKLMNETVPIVFSRLEHMIKNNGGYLAGGKLTWADLYVVALLDLFDHDLQFNTSRDYPNVAALRNKVMGIPSIKEWIAKRPVTDR